MIRRRSSTPTNRRSRPNRAQRFLSHGYPFICHTRWIKGEPMDPRQVKTAADARKIIQERGLTHVKVGVHDIDGVLRGKYLHVDKFSGALDGNFGFCDVVLGWDSNDQLYDNVTY